MEARNVLGAKDEFFRILQKEFPGCRMTARGNELLFIGDEEVIVPPMKVVAILRELNRENTYLTTQHVRYSSDMIRQGREEELRDIYADTVSISARGRLIKPKTAGQKRYVDSIRRNLVTFGIGPAGTGKTYLAVASAVDAYERNTVERIILTRPAVEAGERLGFLPGDLSQKVDPYLRPLYDALFDLLGFEKTRTLMERQTIEIAPLAYMRGRTLNNAFIILDEAQNTTPEQMKMFLTRIGFGSKAVITGDITQIDLPRGTHSGLIQAQHVLAGVRGIAFTYFTAADVVRHPLVARIVEAYEKDAESREKGRHGIE